MGTFERFKTKAHLKSLKRFVVVTALAALAVKLLVVALATAAGDGTPLDLLARAPASLADLAAALLVFEVLRSRRPLQLAARSAALVAVSPLCFVASGIYGDPLAVAVALLLAAVYLLVDRDAPLVAGMLLGLASRVEPLVLLAAPVAMAATAAPKDPKGPEDPEAPAGAGRSRLVHFGGALVGAVLAAWVPVLAWGWDSPVARAVRRTSSGGPGGLGPGWLLGRPLDGGLAGWLLGPGRPLVLAAAALPAAVWAWRRPRRVYAAAGLALLAPLALSPAWSPRELVWPAVLGYLGDARWASIYTAVAGATLVWTSSLWGPGVPWEAGVPLDTLPSGAVAGLGLLTWVVLCCWLVLGWRTVLVEAWRPRPAAAHQPLQTVAEPAEVAAGGPPGGDGRHGAATRHGAAAVPPR
jgi:hypothetical protein